MDLYPAIDLRGGRCVRLLRGDYERETVYHDDPVAVAERFAASGARWIHVVDLDAARTGSPMNRDAIGRIATAVRGRAAVQAGGGVRSLAAAAALADVGAARVVVGTAAVEDPDLVPELAARQPVAVGLDARDGRLAVRGWRADAGTALLDLLPRFADAGVAALVVTEISRDGTLEGPDLSGLGAVLAATPLPVVASGGVGSLAHLEALANLRVGDRALAGAIVGKALYEGRVDLVEAVARLAATAPGEG